ncbi:ATP-binding cassette domain-containing protein, partial [Akkermansiaceae bacterium]|nr:ATP-binding cassette domain-containing protein [Akkermansiaceae bacterium]
MSELEVRPGKSLGIVGRNGSGKTTLASKLAEENGATLVSFELENELLEREIREDDSEFLNRIDFGRSVREMIEEVCLDGEKLKGIAERLGLSQILEQGFLTLSTGERRRLMLARALVKNPKLIVLDEPFDGLDHAFRQPLRDLLEGRDLVLVVNRLSDLEGLVDDVCCIEDGAVILNGSLEEVFKNEAFQQLMGLNDGELVLPKGESISPSSGALVS